MLKAVLEPRGAVVQRTRTQSLPSGRTGATAPDVVVVDGDERQAEPAAWRTAPHVVIASECVPVSDPKTRFLQKPFQFPELIRTIEDLLGSGTATPAAVRD